MVSAVHTALGGLRTAALRLDEAAQRIVHSGAAIAARQPAASRAPARPQPPASPKVAGLHRVQEQSGLAGGVIALKEAELLYAASARLLARLHGLEGQLLRIES